MAKRALCGPGAQLLGSWGCCLVSPQRGECPWLSRQVGAVFSRGSALLLLLPPPVTRPIPVLPCLLGTLSPSFCLQHHFPFSWAFCERQETGPQTALEPGFQGGCQPGPHLWLSPHSCWSTWARARASWTWGWPRPGAHSARVATTLRWRSWTLERNATSPWGWPGRWALMLAFCLGGCSALGLLV